MTGFSGLWAAWAAATFPVQSGRRIAPSMTLRTTLLAVCMVAVPGVALFSHRVPAHVRAGTRDAVTKAVAWCRDAVMPNRTTQTPAPEPDVGARPGPAPAGPDAVAARPMPPTDRPEQALARLGVTSLECRPLPGQQGGHVASCAVALDADGQLLRVFHGTGRDRDAALTALAAEVDGWRSRFAGAGRGEHPVSSAAHP